jgi:hypothetical protein
MLKLMVRLKYVDRKQVVEVWKMAEGTGKLLNGLIRALTKKPRA